MATIKNSQARLLQGPSIGGHKPARWLPGLNPLDLAYWGKASQTATVKRWIGFGWLTVDEHEDMPDPNKVPSAKELAEFDVKELRAALESPTVPVQWHPSLEAELAKRESDALAERLPPTKPVIVGRERKSLSGLKVEDALVLIAAEHEIETLEAWAESDKRKSVDEAIDKRLTELASGGGG
jgi:hypothetical protein